MTSINVTQKKRSYNRDTTAEQVLDGIDLSGKTVLITGANNGIGLETARAMARHNAHVIMACRNLQSAEEAKRSIMDGFSNLQIDILYFDCAKLKSVREFANEYIKKGWPINILILNAGVFGPPEKFTEDGFESTFQINHLAHFYLVQLLQDVILKSAPMRIVTVATVGHKNGAFDPDNVTHEYLSPTKAEDIPSAGITYMRSKFCNVLFSNELQRRLGDKGVTSNSLHPGAVRTQIARNTAIGRFFFKLPFLPYFNERVITMDKGAATSVFVATAPELEGIGGKYFDVCKEAPPSPKAYNEETAKKLWELSEKMIKDWNNSQLTVPS